MSNKNLNDKSIATTIENAITAISNQFEESAIVGTTPKDDTNTLFFTGSSFSLQFRKIYNMVVVCFIATTINNNNTGTATNMLLPTIIPSAYRPTSDCVFPLRLSYNSAWSVTAIRFKTNGDIVIYKTIDETTFAIGDTLNIQTSPGCFSYTLD